MILFNEEVHKYTVESAPDMKLTSVSTIISLLKEKFDADYWAEKKAKERGITKEEILKEWEDKKIKSQERGTAFHLEKEKEALAKKGAVPAIVRENGLKQAFDLKSLTPGVYPELIVYSLLHNAVGTADIVEIYEDKTFFLGDYKTNEELKFESFKRFDKISKERKPVMMNSPVQHLEDCSGMHYTLQLSLYAYMLEQFGFTCKELKIYHAILNENNECVNVIEYPIEYKKKEAHTILNWFKKQNNE